jgi:hypothetical protein
MEAANGMLGRLSWQGMLSGELSDTIYTKPSINIQITPGNPGQYSNFSMPPLCL